MLKTAIGRRQRVVICIDGLDESLAAHRTGLLRSLQAITQELPNVRLFLTGRPFIRGEIEKYFPTADAISISPAKEDTKTFLKVKLAGDSEPDAMDESLRADIMEIIPQAISEIFLLVSLSIEAILAETTIYRRKQKLKQMSKGQDVGDIYTATFQRIKGQENARSRLGMEAIMWVAYSERPLQPDELCQALGVEVGSKDLNKDNAPKIRTIMNCTLGLVTVDSSSSTVRLVHFTLQEYILANSKLFRSPHSMIAEVCLTYLNFAYIRGLSPTLSAPPPTTPFLQYASCHWGAHARREIGESAIPLALKLLDSFEAHVSCKLLLLKEGGGFLYYDTSGGRPIRFTGLYGGALLGVLEIMVSSFDIRKWDLNATDLCGRTALAWAVLRGHNRDVKILLEQEGVIPDMADEMGVTPFSWASTCGHSEIVKMLLDRGDVNPNAVDNKGLTPLSAAVMFGCLGVIQILLGRNNVSINAGDESGRTPLSWAASNCVVEVMEVVEIMEMLLGQNDVDPDAADKSGRTPLSWAAGQGNKEAMKLLLKRNDVNPDKADEMGRTPFSWAVVGWLDEEDDDEDMEGRSDLAGDSDTFRSERTIAVKMLLERNDVNPDMADKHGRTPLSWAASYGREEIVEMLLEQNDVNPDTADKSGRTPLSWAASYGREEIVKTLLGRNDVNSDALDERGRTPFLWAIMYGHAEVGKTLLERDNVNSDRADERGRTPLSWASSNGHKGIVEMLLERNDVNLDATDKSGLTPLSWAVIYQQEEIVEMLLEWNSVNHATTDDGGRTPSPWAAESGYEGVAEMPLQWSDVYPSTADGDGRTLTLPTESDYERIAPILLQQSDANSDTANKGVQMQLSCATLSGHEKIADTLSESKNVSPTLAPATESGLEGVVDMAFEWGDVNCYSADEIGGPSFPWAPGGSSEAITEMPFDPNDINPNPADLSGQTPFPWVTENGFARVA